MVDSLPWSERLRIDQIGKGAHRTLTTNAATRARVAEALDLQDIPALAAEVDIQPSGLGWRLSGRVTADVVQTCGITLEPLPAAIDTRFSVDLVQPEHAPESDRVIDADLGTPDGPDVVEDGGVDLAAYVVEHLALALDPWPRKPGAVFEAPEAEPEPSPFDVLKSLKPGS